MFESTISAGTIIFTAVTIITSAVIVSGFVWAIRGSVAVLGIKLDVQDRIINELKDETKKLATVVTEMAVATVRQDGFEKRLILQGERLDKIEDLVTEYLKKVINHSGVRP